MNKNDEMHPNDMRNLIIFGVVSIILYFGFSTFILEPQQEAMRKQAEARAQVQQEIASNPKLAEQFIQVDRAEAVLSSQNQRIQIENAHLSGSLNLTGARLDDLSFKDYFKTLNSEENVVLFSPAKTELPRYAEYGWLSADDSIKTPGKDTQWSVRGNDKLSPDNPVILYWDNGQGITFEREYALDKDYMIRISQRVQNNSGKEVTLYPYGLIAQRGIPADIMNAWVLHEGPIAYIGEELIEVDYKDFKKKPTQSYNASEGWIALTEKYFAASLIPQYGVESKYRFNFTPDAVSEDRGLYQIDYLSAAVVIPAGENAVRSSHLFAGAKQAILLGDYEENLGIHHFDLMVDFGWFYFMTKPFYYILHWFGEFTGNMGIAIILLTLMIRSAVFPLTNTSYRSFAKMKKVTPQIVELREKFGDDKMTLQTKMMELYQREGVNPMAGCFPILLQIPIFFALYKVLFVTIEMRHAPFFGWIEDLSARDPTSLFNLFGLLPYDVPGFLTIGIWPCLMLVAMIMQKRLNPPPQDKIQRDMMNLFPFVITFVMSQFAAGLVIYWTFSAYISVIQQVIIMRSLGVPIHLFGESEDEKKMDKAVEKGPDVHPLVEMAENEAEEAIFGDDDEPKQVSKPKPKKSKKKK